MRREITPSFVFSLAAVLTAGVLLPLMAGCQGVSPRPLHLHMGLDASGSARDQLGVYALTAATLSARLRPGRDGLSLYRVDNDCREFSSGETIGGAEATMKVIIAETKKAADRPRTLPALFWERAAQRAAEGKDGDAAFLLASDGDNDDMRPDSERRIRRSAQTLAKNPRVRLVLLCGVRPANAARLRATFAPLGERFRLILRSEVDPKKIAARLTSVRRP